MYAQTFHGKYIHSGHLSRDVPRFPYEGLPLFRGVDRADTRPDILPLSDPERENLLRSMRVRYLVLHGNPDSEQVQAQVAAGRELLGPLSEVYRDETLSAYQLDEVAAWLDNPQRTPAELPLFVSFRDTWPRLEQGETGWHRWLPERRSRLWLYSAQPRRVVLEIKAYSLPGARPLEIRLDDELMQTLPIEAGLPLRHYFSAPLELPTGPSTIGLHAPQGGVSPREMGIGTDTRELSFSIHLVDVHGLK